MNARDSHLYAFNVTAPEATIEKPFRGTISQNVEDLEFSELMDYVYRVQTGEVLAHRVRLDLSRICSLQCPFCFAKLDAMAPSGSLHRQVISLEHIRALIPQFQRLGVRLINLYGGGEPTMHPQAPEVVSALAEGGFNMRIITNGVGMRAPLREAIVQHRHRFDSIRFSFPGVCPESYALIAGAPTFDRVLKHVRLLADALSGFDDGPELALYVPVTMSFKKESIFSFVSTAASIGVKWLFFREDTRSPKEKDALHANFPEVQDYVEQAAEETPGFPVFYTIPMRTPARPGLCWYRHTDFTLIPEPLSGKLLIVDCEQALPTGHTDLPDEENQEIILPEELFQARARQLQKARVTTVPPCPGTDHCLAAGRNNRIGRVMPNG